VTLTAHPVTPEDPEDPTDPVDPIDPIDPVDPVDPTDPTDPPANPTDPPADPGVPISPSPSEPEIGILSTPTVETATTEQQDVLKKTNKTAKVTEEEVITPMGDASEEDAEMAPMGDVAEAVVAEIVPDGLVPATTVEDNKTPLAAAPAEAVATSIPAPVANAWALLNLILTIAAAAITATLLVAWARRRNSDELEAARNNGKGFLAIVSAVATVVAVVLFALTQNMALPMEIVDGYTVFHVVLAAGTGVMALLTANKKDEADARA
jgi:hypothetical protein